MAVGPPGLASMAIFAVSFLPQLDAGKSAALTALRGRLDDKGESGRSVECRAYGARILFGIDFPALPSWADVWRSALWALAIRRDLPSLLVLTGGSSPQLRRIPHEILVAILSSGGCFRGRKEKPQGLKPLKYGVPMIHGKKRTSAAKAVSRVLLLRHG